MMDQIRTAFGEDERRHVEENILPDLAALNEAELATWDTRLQAALITETCPFSGQKFGDAGDNARWVIVDLITNTLVLGVKKWIDSEAFLADMNYGSCKAVSDVVREKHTEMQSARKEEERRLATAAQRERDEELRKKGEIDKVAREATCIKRLNEVMDRTPTPGALDEQLRKLAKHRDISNEALELYFAARAQAPIAAAPASVAPVVEPVPDILTYCAEVMSAGSAVNRKRTNHERVLAHAETLRETLQRGGDEVSVDEFVVMLERSVTESPELGAQAWKDYTEIHTATTPAVV